MNKGILIGIAIAVIIGVGAIAVSNNYSETSEISVGEETSEISVGEETRTEGKNFSVGLNEQIGITGG